MTVNNKNKKTEQTYNIGYLNIVLKNKYSNKY